jgi:metal-responsive CopG/Arc/MetJ family transcriptional regulator
MKTKTSIVLSVGVIKKIDRLAGSSENRSQFIETALRAYIAQLVRKSRAARDLQLINRHAARLNAEALDVLGYQEDW